MGYHRGVGRRARVGFLLLAAACGSSSNVVTEASSANPVDDGPPPPDAHCKSPGPLGAGPHFTDVTSEVGLDGVIGIRISSADLDGDGLPDIVVHGTSAKRDTFDAPSKRIFMNRGGHFEDTTKESGLLDSRDGAGTGRVSSMAVFADVDNDGDLDLFSGTYVDPAGDGSVTDRSEVFLNDGKGHFSLAPKSSTSKQALPTAGAAFTDVNRDGFVDVFVTAWYDGDEGAGSYLYLGKGDGTFVDASKSSGILRPEPSDVRAATLDGTNRKPAYGATACDLDDDGDPDLVVSSYGRSFNELWRNDDGVFEEIGYGTPIAADTNLDYKSDNEFYHCWCKAHAGSCPAAESSPKIDCTNYSWTPGFDDQPARNAGNTFSTACADLDNDGDLDLIHATIRHWHIGNSADPSQIVRNDGNMHFTRVANDERGLLQPHASSDWNEGNITVAAFDFDNDGKKDIYLGSSDYPDTYGRLYHQVGDGFEDVTESAGAKHYHAVSHTSVDIDGDGDLDLIVVTSAMRCGGDPKCAKTPTLKVYRNEAGANANFVQLHLKGTTSNAAAIGAKVTVTAGGVKQVQEVNGGYGTFGMQNDTMLTFGLGAACTIDAIEVRWPNGEKTVQAYEGVVANHLAVLTEGEAKAKYLR